jgi:hypothetical protein
VTYYAAWAVDQGPDEAPSAVSIAKASEAAFGDATWHREGVARI